MSQFHLFRAPGEPGYIEGAMTGAGHIDLPDTGDKSLDDAIVAAYCSVAEAMGLTLSCSGDLTGPVGLLLDEDYMLEFELASRRAVEAF